MSNVVKPFEGTRLGRQELNAELLEDTPGALWSRDLIERYRVHSTPQLSRVVVAIDPSGSSGKDSDECGIVVAGIDGGGQPPPGTQRAHGSLKPDPAQLVFTRVW